MVFVGRGAQFILPRELGLAVRLIAPKKQRVQQITERRQCSRHDAEKFVDETDIGRADFVQRYFHHDVADSHLYDLVINLERLPREVAVELIANEAKRLQQDTAGELSGRMSAHRQFHRLNKSPIHRQNTG
jgi:cytidylate kinase